MKTWEFFELVYSGELLNELDIYNQIESITDQFEQRKIQLLCDDFDRFLIRKRNEKYGSQVELLLKKEKGEVNEKEYFKKLSGLKKPIIFIDNHFDDSGKLERKLIKRAKYNISNDGCLNEFYLSALKGLLIDLKRKHIDQEPQISNIQPIQWLKGEESLRQFLDIIKSDGLIENRETDDLIQEHFYVDGKEPTKDPNPINWLKSKVLLAYLIEGLSTKPSMHEPFIEPDKKWQLTKLHFTVKGKEIGRSLVNDIKQSRFPNGCEKIDSILKRLT